LPSYRLREDSSTTTVDDETGAKKGMQLSKEVKQLRDYESYLLETYRKYLQILEKLVELNPQRLCSKVGLKE
jgi:hypothetical protein